MKERTKYCSRCKGERLPLTHYAKRIDRFGKLVRYYVCHDCANKARRAYSKTPEGRIRIYTATMKSYAKILGYEVKKL